MPETNTAVRWGSVLRKEPRIYLGNPLAPLGRVVHNPPIPWNMEVPMIESTRETTNYSGFVNMRQARWLIGVLGMLMAVVGKDSLLGLILGQTRREVASLV